MLFTTKRTFQTPAERAEFAQKLAHIVNGDNFEPFKPNEHDDYYWKIDQGNNWGVAFFESNPNRFSVTYRYQSITAQAEESLAEWIKYRLNCNPVKE